MNSFDDIFEGHVSQRGQTNQPFDKEAWAEKNRQSASRSMTLLIRRL